MITYTTGNLLDADVEALVNTVNTVGVMGKGIALMFKERFPNNMKAYADACKRGEVVTGKMFVTHTNELMGAKWIINFPTKQHWRAKSQLVWIEQGLADLHNFMITNQVKSIAIPPLGAGNGGLDWQQVKPLIEKALSVVNADIIIYEPTKQYQNVSKTSGVNKLTVPRALIAKMVYYYSILGFDCSLLEIQKLAYFLQRSMIKNGLADETKLSFVANRYGPYADSLRHLLDKMDGSYLQSNKRIADSDAFDTIYFNHTKTKELDDYLQHFGQAHLPSLKMVTNLIDGFETPYGMELLATVDWLIAKENYQANVASIKKGLANWQAGEQWAKRKQKLFDDKSIALALERLKAS